MENPFQIIYDRLDSIESLLIEIARKDRNEKGNNGETDTIFNVPQAAEFLGLTVPTIYSKVSRGDIPAMKKGNRLYFSRQELITHLRSGKKKSTSEILSEAETYVSTHKSFK